MAIAPPRHSEYDLEQVRETTLDRVELLDGEIVVTPAPALSHQDIVGNLYTMFRIAIRDTGLGHVYLAPADVVLSSDTIVQPDLVVVLADRRLTLTDKRIEGAPSLVVEVISPTTGVRDMLDKRRIYARFEVPEYWLVDPSAFQVTVFSQPRNGEYRSEQVAADEVASATVAGVTMTTAAVFAPGPDF